MNQSVTAAELSNIVFERRLDGLIGQFGYGYHRKIDFLVGTAEYVVMDHHEAIWSGHDPERALEVYYNIPQR